MALASSPASRSRTPDAGRLGRLLRATSNLLATMRLDDVVDAALRPGLVARRLAERVTTRAYAKLYLRACDRVGARPRCYGPARIDNQGTMAIGDHATLGGELGSISLTTAPGGALSLGDRVIVHHGSWISAAREVSVGSDVTIGPYCVVADAEADTPGCRENATPIVIGDGVRLDARVVVRPGARIGDGAVIGAGSVVEGAIPPRALASGAPARVIGVRGPDTRDEEGDGDEGPASERRRRAGEEIGHACV